MPVVDAHHLEGGLREPEKQVDDDERHCQEEQQDDDGQGKEEEIKQTDAPNYDVAPEG